MESSVSFLVAFAIVWVLLGWYIPMLASEWQLTAYVFPHRICNLNFCKTTTDTSGTK